MSSTCLYCGSSLRSTKALQAHISQREFCRNKEEAAFHEPESDIDPPLDSVSSPEPGWEDQNMKNYQPMFSSRHSTPAATVEEIEDDPTSDYVYAMSYPGPAGMPLNDHCSPTQFEAIRQKQTEKALPPWTPFQSEKEWELARWLMSSGISQQRIDEFCKLEVVQDGIKPSFHNSRSLLRLIDSLECGPAFKCTPFRIEGDLKDMNGELRTEVLELWHRDPVEIIKELMGNSEFRGHQKYTPVQHYTDTDMKNREYSEMWTCDWWWNMQKQLPTEYGTIAPVIIASDQTQLSTFSGDKKAWPPLQHAGRHGVKMICADGFERLVYAFLAAYMADYPEQCLICCCKENSCPRCTIKPNERGQLIYSLPRSPALTLVALSAEARGEKPEEFRSQNLRPINPFWEDLPHCNIFECMTPDLLHQLQKGVFGDHVAKWAQSAMGDEKLAEKEMDNRFRTMSPNPNLRHFSKGISSITQWTGNEYRLIAGAAVRALEDFMFYAHFEVHTDHSLAAMDTAWSTFHDRKDVFLELGLRTHFNISKLHNVSHYLESIRSRGTNDNFNTEFSDRLHIDLSKNGYRASNKRNFQPQMTKWLTRQEAIHRRDQFMGWIEEEMTIDKEDDDVGDVEDDSGSDQEPAAIFKSHVAHAKQAPIPRTSVHEIENKFGCGEWFIWYLEEYLKAQLLPTNTLKDPTKLYFPVWKKIVLTLPAVPEAESEKITDTVYATAATSASITHRGVQSSSPAKTSTVVIRTGQLDIAKGPLSHLQIARVKLLFKLPHQISLSSPLLAFVDWFKPLNKYHDSLGMYQLSYATRQHVQHSGIVLASAITQTCHLIPEFGRTTDSIPWDSTNVLDKCSKFFVNPYLRHRDFLLFQNVPVERPQKKKRRR
ncbi:hypothetical protein DFJ43DRAFT_1133141 [Lentinula guzmanii]|uniref:C2H2-type domain-containing protein n=1 Tax=Lentinula guzmanii TaxID=2804957 RepID=A0AA38JFF6_9AGAR|nr:hypothetical protein DFJ43DRAFT_1133141 [Lentinula guzmanii]